MLHVKKALCKGNDLFSNVLFDPFAYFSRQRQERRSSAVHVCATMVHNANETQSLNRAIITSALRSSKDRTATLLTELLCVNWQAMCELSCCLELT
jgi:hypothetical protein